MRPTQCEGGLYLMVADSLAPLPFNNNNNTVFLRGGVDSAIVSLDKATFLF